MTTVFGTIVLSEALKVVNHDREETHYALKLSATGEAISFDQLIIRTSEENTQTDAYILRYSPDPDWRRDYLQNPHKRYTGTIRKINLSGKILQEIYMQDGSSQRTETNNGRLASEQLYCDWEIHISRGTGRQLLILIPCADDSGGDGSGDGGVLDNGGGGAGDGDYSYGEGGDSEDPHGYVRDGGGYPMDDDLTTDDSEEDYSDYPVIPKISFEEMLAAELSLALDQDPNLLIDIPCDQLEKWQDVASHTPPQSVVDKMETLKDQFTDFDILALENAEGKTVNMDYFSVNISRLPNNMSPTQLLDSVRLNINDLINTFYSKFIPEGEVETGYDESFIWNSTDPLGAILNIEIPGDEGSVICSYKDASKWRFSTIKSPWDGKHPVSGTREFGFETNPDGSYTFYTRGVDRMTNNLKAANLSITAIDKFKEDLSFFAADLLWESFQSGIKEYIEKRGGSVSINSPETKRPDWDKVKEVLLGNAPVKSLDCQ